MVATRYVDGMVVKSIDESDESPLCDRESARITRELDSNIKVDEEKAEKSRDC